MKLIPRPALVFLAAGLLLASCSSTPVRATETSASTSPTFFEVAREGESVSIAVALRDDSSLSAALHPSVQAVQRALAPVLEDLDSRTVVRSIQHRLETVFPGLVVTSEMSPYYRAVWNEDKMAWEIVCCGPSLTSVRLGKIVDVHVEVIQKLN